MTPEDAQKLGVEDKEIVSVKVDSNDRPIIFGETVIRVSPKFSLAMHIDTDEANAANVGNTNNGAYFFSAFSIATSS